MPWVKSYFMTFVFLLLCCSTVKGKNADQNISKKDTAAQKIMSHLLSSSLFEKNDGQYDDPFEYRFTNGNACVDFYKNQVRFSVRKAKTEFNPQKIEESVQFEYVTWSLEFAGAKSAFVQNKEVLTTSNVSSFRANGSSIKQRNTASIFYENIYPNIDLVFYKSEDHELKYDFILHPNAKLSDIAIIYHGVQDIDILENGNLSYVTELGTIHEKAPYSFVKRNKNEVRIDYALKGDTLKFDADFNVAAEEIILDPIYVDWSSYFYGTGRTTTGFGYTWVYDLDIDANNSVYVAGMTNDRFPSTINTYDTSTNGYYDAFICKLTPAGDSIIWFSYLGGSNYEYCFALAVNAQEQPVVSGFTYSSDFPVTVNAFDKTPNINNGAGNYFAGYVTKFSKNGDSLIFSTFLGGSKSDLIQSMVLDDSNYVYITGQTSSPDFPVTTGAYQTTFGGASNNFGWYNTGDAFLTKMKPDGSGLVFSTFIGGVYDDVAYQVALGPNRDIFIVGKTTSTNFPTTDGSGIFNSSLSGTSDGFICKFNPTGTSLSYSQMMGGSGEDWFEGVYINKKNEAYVAGISKSSNFYTTSSAYQKTSRGMSEAVIVKMNPGGQNVIYSTYLGGSGDEIYYSGYIYNSNIRIAANVREEAIICGITRSTDYPVTSDALMTTNPSSNSGSYWNTAATITKLDYFGSKLLYGTYYGGSSFEIPGANKLKRISCFTNILYGGFTASSDYPTTTGAYKQSKSSSSTGFFWTGFISKFRDTLYTDAIDLSLEDTIIECDQVFEILNAKNIGADIIWSNGKKESVIIVEKAGPLFVQATYGCDTVRDSIYIKLEYRPKVPVLPSDSVYCDIMPTLFLDAGNDSMLANYTWSTGDKVKAIQVSDPSQYWVKIETPHCGTKYDTINIGYKLTPDVTLPRDSVFCNTISWTLRVGDSLINDEVYSWNTGDTTSFLTVKDTGFFKVVGANVCGIDSSEITIRKLITPSIRLPDDSAFCNQINWTIKYGMSDNREAYSSTNLETGTQNFASLDSITLKFPQTVEVKAQNKCGIAMDTLKVTLFKTPDFNLANDTTFCDNLLLPINLPSFSVNDLYTWSDNTNSASRVINQPGVYWAEIKNKCGVDRDTINLYLLKSLILKLPEDSVFCDQINWNVNGGLGANCMYLWNSGSMDSILSISQPGIYKLKVSNYCGSVTDSIVVDKLASPQVDLKEDKVFCEQIQSVTYNVGLPGNSETYLWSNGNTTNQNTIATSGLHWVTISNKCDLVSDSVRFTLGQNPIVDLGPDTTLCGEFNLLLDAGNAGMDYLWQPFGETSKTIRASEQTTYTVTVTSTLGCVGSDKFVIRPDCISKSFIPNAFSPNGDGLNDIFKPTLINFEKYTLSIYNRWGAKVFESNSAELGWDGLYDGRDAPQGVYSYVMRYKTTENDTWQNKSGALQLIR